MLPGSSEGLDTALTKRSTGNRTGGQLSLCFFLFVVASVTHTYDSPHRFGTYNMSWRLMGG